MRNLGQFTQVKLLVPRLLSTRRESAIIELSKRLENAGRIARADAFIKAVLEQESLASSAYDGVAVPLAHGAAVRKLSFAVGLAPQPIRWQEARASGVHTLVLFAVPLPDGNRYLRLMRALAEFLNDEAAFAALRHCAQPEEMLDLLNQVRIAPATRASASAAPAPETSDSPSLIAKRRPSARRVDDIVRLCLLPGVGHFDLASLLNELHDGVHFRVGLDVSAVTHLGTVELRVLRAFAERSVRRGGFLKLENASADLVESVRSVGLQDLLLTPFAGVK